MNLDSRIRRVGEVVTEAFVELNKLQKREKLLLKTGFDMIDSHIGGLLAGDCVVIAGAPSSGKSETLYRTIENVMDENINPKAKGFVSLEYSMEMKMLNKVLRSTHNITGKKKSEILFNAFTEEEQKKVKTYYDNLQDDRRYVVQAPVTPEEFYSMTRDFCKTHADKEAVLLSADHLLLFTGSDKQAVLEKVSEYVNLLKLEFNNVYFLLLSQLNRSHLTVIKESSNDMIPTNAQIFGSSFMEQLASYIVIITNPFNQAINQYLKVSKDRYDYLSDFYGDTDSKDRVSFSTLGNLFYFVTKMRESDNSWKNLYIRKMDLTDEQLNKMKQSFTEKSNTSISIPTFNTPVFDSTPAEKKVSDILPNPRFEDLKDIFGAPAKSNNNENVPF